MEIMAATVAIAVLSLTGCGFSCKPKSVAPQTEQVPTDAFNFPSRDGLSEQSKAISNLTIRQRETKMLGVLFFSLLGVALSFKWENGAVAVKSSNSIQHVVEVH